MDWWIDWLIQEEKEVILYYFTQWRFNIIKALTGGSTRLAFLLFFGSRHIIISQLLYWSMGKPPFRNLWYPQHTRLGFGRLVCHNLWRPPFDMTSVAIWRTVVLELFRFPLFEISKWLRIQQYKGHRESAAVSQSFLSFIRHHQRPCVSTRIGYYLYTTTRGCWCEGVVFWCPTNKVYEDLLLCHMNI